MEELLWNQNCVHNFNVHLSLYARETSSTVMHSDSRSSRKVNNSIRYLFFSIKKKKHQNELKVCNAALVGIKRYAAQWHK